MANRFWVAGGTGNWSSTTNWSTTTGGSSGAAVPTSADDVFVNALSGASPTITVDATSNCLSLDFTGAITPTLAGTSGINLFGNITFIAAMTTTMSSFINFSATSTGKTITTAGQSLNFDCYFVGVGGGWTFQDNFTSTKTIQFQSGTLDTNGKAVTVQQFSGSGSTLRVLTLGASIITVNGTTTLPWNFATTTNLTFNVNTSSIVMGIGTTGKSFSGGGLTYYNVTFLDTNITVVGNNTFGTLTFTSGKIVKLTSGSTQTYTTLNANGTPSSKISIQSVTAGSAATLSKSSGVSAIRNITLKDITATGGATFYALGTTNVSGNTGWAFQMLIKQEKLSGTEMALYHIDSNGAMQKVSG